MNYRCIIAATVIAIGISAPASNPGAAPARHTIGYVGCSNTEDAVIGYHFTPGADAFWPMYDIGGQSIKSWVPSNPLYQWVSGERPAWRSFVAETTAYGRPKYVWVQLCENYPKKPDTYDDVRRLLTNLREHMPEVDVFISAINTYQPNPDLCKLMGPQGQGVTDTIQWRDQAVADGLAKKGPDMGPLTASLTIADGCHPNRDGMLLLGRQLHAFFDILP